MNRGMSYIGIEGNYAAQVKRLKRQAFSLILNTIALSPGWFCGNPATMAESTSWNDFKNMVWGVIQISEN